MRFPWSRKSRRSRDDDLSDLLVKRGEGVVHLTHNDLDAVGCDAIHRMRYGQVTSIFCSVGRFPHVLDYVSRLPGNGDILSITDLGYHTGIESTLASVTNQGWKVEWRDHHRWQEEEIRRVRDRCDLLHVQVDTCATGICSRDLEPENPVAAEVARVVCDYDLWKHEDPRSAVLGEVLQRRNNRDHVRDCLVKGVFSDDHIMDQYREIRQEMEAMMDRSIGRTRIMGNRYRIGFAPLYGYPSETAARMRRVLSTDMEVLVSPGGRFSLRSVPPVSHLLARHFNGGGHPNASGGTFPFSFLDRVRFRLTVSAPQFGRFVEIAETLE